MKGGSTMLLVIVIDLLFIIYGCIAIPHYFMNGCL